MENGWPFSVVALASIHNPPLRLRSQLICCSTTVASPSANSRAEKVMRPSGHCGPSTRSISYRSYGAPEVVA